MYSQKLGNIYINHYQPPKILQSMSNVPSLTEKPRCLQPNLHYSDDLGTNGWIGPGMLAVAFQKTTSNLHCIHLLHPVHFSSEKKWVAHDGHQPGFLAFSWKPIEKQGELNQNNIWGWTHGAASHLFHVKLHPTLTSNVDTSISTNWWICEGILSQGMWIQWFGQKISPKLLPSQASRLLSVLNMKLETLNTHTSPASSQSQEHSSWMDFFSDFYLERTTSVSSFSAIFNLSDFFSPEKFWDTTLESHPFSCLLPKLPAGNYVLLYLLQPLHTNQGSHRSIAPLLESGGFLRGPNSKNGDGWIPHAKNGYTNWTSNWGDFSSCWTKAREKIDLLFDGLLVDWCSSGKQNKHTPINYIYYIYTSILA